jgi:hypothetical protein
MDRRLYFLRKKFKSICTYVGTKEQEVYLGISVLGKFHAAVFNYQRLAQPQIASSNPEIPFGEKFFLEQTFSSPFLSRIFKAGSLFFSAKKTKVSFHQRRALQNVKGTVNFLSLT